MTEWVIFAIIAYLLFALNGVADKFLLTKAVGNPGVFTFYVGVGSLLVFALAPFGLKTLSAPDFFLALAGGFAFTFALYFFYSAIQQTSISRILPIEGGLVPVFTLVLAYLSGTDRLNGIEFAAFLFLVSGAVLVAFKKTETGWTPLALRNAIIAGFLFALSFVLTKHTYDQTNFISGLIWTRLGLGVGALTLLFSPRTRKGIFDAPRQTTQRNKILFYLAHTAGSAGSWLQNYAIAIGSVVIVNALQGVQFVFILLLSVITSRFYPKIIKEDISGPILAQKIFAIILISTGLILISLQK